MRKLKLILLLLTLTVSAVLSGCSDNEDSENTTIELAAPSFVQKAIANTSEQNLEKENLPVWLTEFIHNLKPDNKRNIAAFQAKWKGEVIYYVYDDYFSCIWCTTFKSDGQKIDWTENNIEEFWDSVQNWEVIYLSKFKNS